MDLGISSYSFPWAAGVAGLKPVHPMSAQDLLRLAMVYEVKFVQFGDNLPLHELSQQELKQLQYAARSAGIGLQPGTKGLTFANMDRYISLAQQFSSPFIRVVIDDAGYEPDENEVKEIIRKLLPRLRESGVTLAIENHDRFSASVLKRIITTSDPQFVGVCLDTANSLGAGEGIDHVLDLLGPFTVNLHVKDIRIQRVQHKMGFVVEGCAAGEGVLDLVAIINRLRLTGRCLVATIELWMNPESTIEQTLTKEKQLAERSIQYLKRILA